MVHNYILEAIDEHRLPRDFRSTVDSYYLPLAERIALAAKSKKSCYLLGVQGSQGSGKSTLADFLKRILEQQHALSCVSLSIDDFYLTRKERESLAITTHPLLTTRGVPGTHDVEMLERTIRQLSVLKQDTYTAVARFNKAIDDRAAEGDWSTVEGPVDVIILEGWCVGIGPQQELDLLAPCNGLEQNEDKDGKWRRFVNQQLETSYTRLFSKLDGLAVLQAPSFDCVYQWRLLQEQKLEQQWQQLPAEARGENRILSPDEVKLFISHYQRLTEHGLATLPSRADWLLSLNEHHKITSFTNKDTHA
ncbi:D-glycerate 3-kinase [Alteromonadaceae bacterium Bs31]|nr:D-glycerate 3-kinase [Alteromonadaceae bacterium Bs31]